MRTVNLNNKEYQVDDELAVFVDQLYQLYQLNLEMKAGIKANDGDKVVEIMKKIDEFIKTE